MNFRFEPSEFDKNDFELIDRFNCELCKDIEKCGVVLASITRISIRVCIVSHRTIYQDFHLFLDSIFNLYQIRIQHLIQFFK